MLDDILTICTTEWSKAKTKKKHPFRYFTLTTTSPDGNPEGRVVVLRNFDLANSTFTVYTDSRSAKVKSLTSHPKAELLFYDPRKLLQIRVKATCVQMEKSDSLFKQQHSNAQKDYTTHLPPGTKIKAMDAVTYADEHHFTQLVFAAFEIEYLRLKRPNHQRAVFELHDQQWIGSFQVP